MFKNPMLNAKFNEYVNKYELNGESEEDNKKKYICYTYLSQIQPERLDRDFDLLAQICDDRLMDLGIIGFAIALNNQLLTTKTDIDDILQNKQKGKFDVYLLTYKKNVNIDNLIDKIKNQKTELEFAEILDYMYSQKIILKFLVK